MVLRVPVHHPVQAGHEAVPALLDPDYPHPEAAVAEGQLEVPVEVGTAEAFPEVRQVLSEGSVVPGVYADQIYHPEAA